MVEVNTLLLDPGHFSLTELRSVDRFLSLPDDLPPEIRAVIEAVGAWHLHHGGRTELPRVIMVTTSVLGCGEERLPEFQPIPKQLL